MGLASDYGVLGRQSRDVRHETSDLRWVAEESLKSPVIGLKSATLTYGKI